MNDKVKQITDKIAYATLATVSKEGEPWNSPVWSLHDHDLTYYWCSGKDSQHSQNIKTNGKVFLVIYDSTVPEGTGEGVYIQAEAQEITDRAEIEGILQKRANIKSSVRRADEFMDDYPRRWYKAVPRRVWINEDGQMNGSFVDIRREVL